jgi:alpha-D-ribose 1-methylphosphonate 5-triphosphate synthase subunit PhnH
MSVGLGLGFHDPAIAAQAHFRGLLDAVASPGRVVALAGELPAPPAPLAPAAFALALALVDHETPVWLSPALRGEAVTASLRFHCGCPIVAERDRAAFAFAASAADLGSLGGFAHGTPDYPDRSTTLVLQIEALATSDAGGVRLTGPGIRDAHLLHAAGVPVDLWHELRASRRLFPLGVDLILVAGDRIAGIPRSTAVEPA